MVFGVIFGQSDDGGSSRSIVIGTRIKHFLAEIAEMVVMGSKHIATVVFLAFYLGNYVEEFIVLQELIIDVGTYGFDAFNGFGSHPDDGFLDYPVAIGFIEFDGGGPCVDDTSVGTLSGLLQTCEVLAVAVGEPELAYNEAVGVFRFCQVGEHLFGIEIRGIHMIHGEFAMHSWGVFAHGVVHARRQFLPISPEPHLASERVDVDGKRLADHHARTGFLEFFIKVFAS